MLGIDRQSGHGQRVEPGADRAFLEASDGVVLEGRNREEVYGSVNRVLQEHSYQIGASRARVAPAR